MSGKILFRESNVISLRTAYITEVGNLVGLTLNPADVTSKIPQGRTPGPQDLKWVHDDWVWLYRRLMSAADELKIKGGAPCVQQKVRALSFEIPPDFKLQWTDSGQSVAVLLNGEPWAFIDEETHRGYSKGILDETWGDQWDQGRFERRFR